MRKKWGATNNKTRALSPRASASDGQRRLAEVATPPSHEARAKRAGGTRKVAMSSQSVVDPTFQRFVRPTREGVARMFGLEKRPRVWGR